MLMNDRRHDKTYEDNVGTTKAVQKCLEVDGDLAAAGAAALLHDGFQGIQRPKPGLP